MLSPFNASSKVLLVFRVLKNLKFLRNTPLDLFSYTHERKRERDLINKLFETIDVIDVDETGAGDVWSASFIIFYYLMKKDLNESAVLSNISASLSVTGISDKKIPKYIDR